jgi:protein-tyrosine phosphatase
MIIMPKFQGWQIRVEDSSKTDLLSYFTETSQWIDAIRKKGKGVLVHCRAGISRSATIVVAYVMKKNNWSAERALEYVASKRSQIDPNRGFRRQLEEYESELDL